MDKKLTQRRGGAEARRRRWPMDNPSCVVINVRDTGGTFRAKAVGRKEVATCTMGRKQAAAACAAKIYGRGEFTLKEVTTESWIAEEVKHG